jgi:RimJ/RimL family protein N-acetyltransferase
MPTVEIKTPRLCLKPLQPHHAEAVARVLNQPGVFKQVSIIPNESDAARLAFAKAWVKQSSQATVGGECILGMFLKDEPHTLVGSIGLHPTSIIHEAEVGYWLDEAFQRRGIMREALEGLLNYATAHTQYTRVMATCALGNTASRNLLMGMGFMVVSDEYSVTLADGSMRPSYLLRRALISDETQKGTVEETVPFD